MTVVSAPRLQFNCTNVVALLGVALIACGLVMVCQHPAAREALQRIAEDPHVRNAIYREAIAPMLRGAGSPNVPPLVR